MKVKDILSDASMWTQGACARDKADRQCSVLSDAAVRFCLRGAAARVYSGQALDAAMEAIARAIGFDGDWYDGIDREIEIWNDNPDRTFEEVRQVIEKADV
jgi:hypothetical protein